MKEIQVAQGNKTRHAKEKPEDEAPLMVDIRSVARGGTSWNCLRSDL
jgi:hypothetical protein